MYFVNFHICTHSYGYTHTYIHTHHAETQPSQTLRSRRLCQQSRPLRVLYELPLGTRHKVKISLQNFPIITCLPLLPHFPSPNFVLPLPGCCFLLQLSLSLHSETTRPPVTATLSLASHGFVKSSNANSFQVPKSVACAFPPPPPSPAPLHSLLELQQLQSLAAPERSQNVVSNASFACSLPTPFHPSLSPPDPCTSMQMGDLRAVHMRRMRNIQISAQATLLFSDSLPDCWADNERLQTAAPGLS